MIPVSINEEKCIGCSLCVSDCPGACLYLENGKARTHDIGCIECGHCFAVCPQGAVRMTGYECEEEPAVSMTELDSKTLLAAMRSRRTIRQFTDRPVEKRRSGRSWRQADTVRPEGTPRAYLLLFWEAGRRRRRNSAWISSGEE